MYHTTGTKTENLRQRILFCFGKADHKNIPHLPDYDVGHGFITLTHNGIKGNVYGGSFLRRPSSIAGVKLAEEINLPYDLKLDIADYSAPNLYDFVIALDDALTLLREKGEIYVGCMGGYGRTGLFIAGLLIAAHQVTPRQAVLHVRQYINRHCVEVKAQHELLNSLADLLLDMPLSDAAEQLRKHAKNGIRCN